MKVIRKEVKTTMSLKQKKLLLLTSKQFDIQFALEAKLMGYRVVTTGNNPRQPAHAYADEYLPFDYSDYDGMVRLVRENEIDALCQGCTDACALLASYLGEKLGIPGHDSYENALIIHQKDKFKEYALKNGIPTPETRWFTDEAAAAAAADRLEWPQIVKPVDRGGGDGISVARSRAEYERSVAYAFSRSVVKHIVVEPFITGRLHSMSTFLIDRKVAAFGTANDYSFHNMYKTNTGLFPADHGPEISEQLIGVVEQVAEQLQLVDGLMHFQYIIDQDNKPWIIEMMRRSPGNRFLSTLSNSTGMNWLEWILRAESGESCSMLPGTSGQKGFYGYHSIMANQNGPVRDIVISPEIRPYVFQSDTFIAEGHVVKDYMNEKLGTAQFGFPDKETSDRMIPRINQLIYVETT